MKPRPPSLPALYVEGTDDVSVVSALLKRHGLDTKQGAEHLWIRPLGDVVELLDVMKDTILTERDQPTGFVLDIDLPLTDRWQAVSDRIKQTGATVSPTCPADGYFGRIPNYPFDFGVWLMPDCRSDGQKLEHLVKSLLPTDHPLWPHAEASTKEASRLVDAKNTALAPGEVRWKHFSETDRIKAEVRSWLAWQSEPGVQLGAAINDHILGHDSAQAIAFLRWLKKLYNLSTLAGI
jgi:hypothetical protein